MKTSQLFTPVRIHTLELKNRIVMASMLTNYASPNGEVTDKMLAYYTERAKGGCGLVMLEAAYVERAGNSYRLGFGADTDQILPGLKRLAQSIHAAGSKVGMQLQHGGRTTNPATNGGRPVALVSRIPGVTPSEGTRLLDETEIEAIVDSYAKAALRAKTAGFDLIELHGAHGYLINQFLSPFTNRRTDAYGGNFEKRLRFPLDVLAACRRAVGDEFPITMRLSVDEFNPPLGLDVSMSAEICRALVAAGINGLNISVGACETNHYTIPPGCVPEACNADKAAFIREAVGRRVSVAVAGRIVNHEVAEAVLQADKADIIVMGRALIADPFLPQKALSGEGKHILPCVACNEGCIGGVARGEWVMCAVNPRAGYETRFPMEQVSNPRRVVVVGAGPAGMQAALTAAERGHSVILLDKQKHLGGLLQVAKLPPHKRTFEPLVTYYAEAVSRLGVDVRLGCEASVDSIQSLCPDQVVVASGSLPLIPRMCEGKPALTAQAVLQGAATGQSVLVLGGGLVGSETAEFLAEQGKQVTILEMRSDIAMDMEMRTRRFLLPRLKTFGVRILSATELVEITDEGRVRTRDTHKRESWLPQYDTLVLAFGYRADETLFIALKDAGVPCVRVGDCIAAGKVMTAVRQGFEAAYAIV